LIRSYHEVAKVLQAIGDVNGALKAIQDAKTAASDLSAQFVDIVDAWEARLRLVQGDIRAASCWVQKSELSVDDKISFQSGDWHYTLARFLIAQSNQQDKEPSDRNKALDQALGLLARLLEAVEAAGAMAYAIEILILQAMALLSQGKVEQALNPLERALSLAEPEGYVRIFIDEGAPMDRLLRRAIARGIKVTYAGRLLTAIEVDAEKKRHPGATAQASMVEPLSERELEVLRLLTTHLSSTDIAGELTISVNTARTHIKSIYGKLDVHSREEAVQKAEKHNLL
jgi:LuxR family maltose regulon positive regulatory protein